MSGAAIEFKWKRFIACLAILCCGIIGLASVAWLGFDKWHESPKNEPIRSAHEVTLVGRYMGWACGGFTPDIRPIDAAIDSIPVHEQFSGFAFYVPPDFFAPDQIDELGVPGNEFVMRGFYYYVIIDGEKKLHNRFDLIAWRLVAPFERWNADGRREKLVEDLDYSEYWKSSGTHKDKFIIAQTYDYDCF